MLRIDDVGADDEPAGLGVDHAVGIGAVDGGGVDFHAELVIDHAQPRPGAFFPTHRCRPRPRDGPCR